LIKVVRLGRVDAPNKYVENFAKSSYCPYHKN